MFPSYDRSIPVQYLHPIPSFLRSPPHVPSPHIPHHLYSQLHPLYTLLATLSLKLSLTVSLLILYRPFPLPNSPLLPNTSLRHPVCPLCITCTPSSPPHFTPSSSLSYKECGGRSEVGNGEILLTSSPLLSVPLSYFLFPNLIFFYTPPPASTPYFPHRTLPPSYSHHSLLPPPSLSSHIQSPFSQILFPSSLFPAAHSLLRTRSSLLPTHQSFPPPDRECYLLRRKWPFIG